MSAAEAALYILLAVSLIAYALTRIALLSIAFIVVFVLLVVEETRRDIHSEGAKKAAKEVAEAIGIVIAIWLIAIVVLGTLSPVDVVPSCSMLPVLKIGDLVILKHISNMTMFLAQHKIPIVNVSTSSYNAMLNNINNEFLAYYAFLNGDKSDITYLLKPGENYSIGLYNTRCLSVYSYLNESQDFYKCLLSNSSQNGNLIKYSYGIGNATVNGTQFSIVYTKSITIGNETIIENYSNPIIVYRTIPSDTFSGDIVHRIFAAIHSGNNYYILTKGDNNQALDIEFGNYPPVTNQVVGYVLAHIPYLGYVTLAFKGGISTAGCSQTIQH
ncbi:MAG: S26 family signal peptidase [Candidatus Micrarchaeaceae archaeon]